MSFRYDLGRPIRVTCDYSRKMMFVTKMTNLKLQVGRKVHIVAGRENSRHFHARLLRCLQSILQIADTSADTSTKQSRHRLLSLVTVFRRLVKISR